MLEEKAPSPCLLNDGNLLVDPKLQETFNTTMDKNEVGKLTSNLSLWAKQLRDAAPLGVTFARVPALVHMRQHGKKCCGAHAVISELCSSNLPKEVSKLEDHIVQIVARLRRKGIGEGQGMVPLPPNFAKVMEATKAAGRKAKEAGKETGKI